MDEAEFKRHLSDLAHGHHHPEEHEWDRPIRGKKVAPKGSGARRAAPRKSARQRPAK